jgi:hypothetical protein
MLEWMSKVKDGLNTMQDASIGSVSLTTLKLLAPTVKPNMDPHLSKEHQNPHHGEPSNFIELWFAGCRESNSPGYGPSCTDFPNSPHDAPTQPRNPQALCKTPERTLENTITTQIACTTPSAEANSNDTIQSQPKTPKTHLASCEGSGSGHNQTPLRHDLEYTRVRRSLATDIKPFQMGNPILNPTNYSKAKSECGQNDLAHEEQDDSFYASRDIVLLEQHIGTNPDFGEEGLVCKAQAAFQAQDLEMSQKMVPNTPPTKQELFQAKVRVSRSRSLSMFIKRSLPVSRAPVGIYPRKASRFATTVKSFFSKLRGKRP